MGEGKVGVAVLVIFRGCRQPASTARAQPLPKLALAPAALKLGWRNVARAAESRRDLVGMALRWSTAATRL